MLKYLIGSSEYGLTVLQIEFTGQETIELDIANFYKDNQKNPDLLQNLYMHINEYVATLDIESQRELYNVFYKVYSAESKQHMYTHDYVINLENSIARASELLNYSRFKEWIVTKEKFMLMPDKVLGEYTYDPDMNTTQEKTYVRHEYRDLIGLIIYMRALSPLYLEYYSYIEKLTNQYYYKLFMLFVRSDIYNCPEIEKVRRYVEVNQQTLAGNGKNEHLIFTVGLSDDDIIDNLVGEIIFNKLIIIDFFNKECNIVSYMFQTIKFKGNFVNSDSVPIRGKATLSEQSKDDISYFEDYRKTSDIAIGTVVEIQNALSDVRSLVHTLGYENFDYDLYDRELSNVRFFMDKGVNKIQTFLLGWFLSKVINPRALHYIEYRKLIELMLFAKVVLLQNNQKFIAMVLSSYKTQESNYLNIVIRTSLNKSLVKRLSEFYTFVMEDDKTTIIEKTIMEFRSEIVNNLWIPVGTPDQLAGIANSDNYLDIPHNINDIICSYIEFVNS